MNIIVRKGKLRDLPFVRKLAVESVVYGIPHTRLISPQQVQRHTIKSLADLEYSLFCQDFELIIAEDTDIGKPVGYLMLILNEVEGSTGELQSYIHDIAVDKRYWGKYVVDKLIARAEEITLEKGLTYIVAHVSASNKRALVYSIKRLKYEVERYQIVKVLKKDKPIKPKE